MRLCGCNPDPEKDRLWCDWHVLVSFLIGFLLALILAVIVGKL